MDPNQEPLHITCTPPPSCLHPYFVLLSFQLASQTLILPDFSRHLFLHFVCLLSHHGFLLDLSALNILMVLTSCILPFPLVSGTAAAPYACLLLAFPLFFPHSLSLSMTSSLLLRSALSFPLLASLPSQILLSSSQLWGPGLGSLGFASSFCYGFWRQHIWIPGPRCVVATATSVPLVNTAPTHPRAPEQRTKQLCDFLLSRDRNVLPPPIFPHPCLRAKLSRAPIFPSMALCPLPVLAS